MNDEDDSQIGFCTDLVALKAMEAFPRSLLARHKMGEWVQVKRLCEGVGINLVGMKDELVAAWLPDPGADRSFVVIIFYDDESKESFAAHYNSGRLLGSTSMATRECENTIGVSSLYAPQSRSGAE